MGLAEHRPRGVGAQRSPSMENLCKLPAKGILRKSSLTFTEHEDADAQFSLDVEKPTKVVVEPLQSPPREYPGETEEERARREEFEVKRRLNRHQEAMKVQIARRLLSQEEGIEEEVDATTLPDINPDDDEVAEDNADS